MPYVYVPRYRPRRYFPRRGLRGRSQGVPAAIAAGTVLAVLVSQTGHATAHHPHHPHHARHVAAPHAAQVAIAYARHRLGCPYLWGGEGPCSTGYDCSGLVWMAYAKAGVHLARTSQDQWATEKPVSKPQPGDLVFFAGGDGTMTSPGHVGIVIGHGQMIEAYATGYPIRIASYDRPDRVGFTQPWGGA